MITFTIPTWNRKEKLRVCLQSLIEQIKTINERILIAVYNNASDDGTEIVLKEFKENHPEIIKYITGSDHVRGEESFKRAFLLADTEWMWMFGDDDILVSGGLVEVVSLLKRKDVDFIHAAEKSRVSGENRIYNATLLDLCQGFGFVEMTGFISGNIARTKKLHEVLNGEFVEIYRDASYFQSLILLDAFASSKAAFINAPIIDLQNNEQTAETGGRWLKEDVAIRYVNIADGLASLVERGKIPSELTEEFFRYLSGNLFGKIMYNFYEHCLVKNNHIESEYWERLYKLVAMLPETERIRETKVIDGFNKALREWMDSVLCTAKALIRVQEAHEPATIKEYPFTYT